MHPAFREGFAKVAEGAADGIPAGRFQQIFGNLSENAANVRSKLKLPTYEGFMGPTRAGENPWSAAAGPLKSIREWAADLPEEVRGTWEEVAPASAKLLAQK